MAYNLALAERIRAILLPLAPVIEKKMFGGIGFLTNGNMAVGVHKEYLIVRVGAENHKAAMSRKGAKPFDITGKPMTGWVMVLQEGCQTEEALEQWITMALEFVKTLPKK